MESMLDNTPSSTKVKKEEKNMTTEQVDVSYSQRPAIDKDQVKKLLKNLSEEYNHKITMGEIVHDIKGWRGSARTRNERGFSIICKENYERKKIQEENITKGNRELQGQRKKTSC